MSIASSTLKALLSADGWQRMSRALSVDAGAPAPAAVDLEVIQAAVATFEPGSSDRTRLEKLLAQAGARSPAPVAQEAPPAAAAVALEPKEEVLLGRGSLRARDTSTRVDATVAGLTNGARQVVHGTVGDDGWFTVRCDLGPGHRIRARVDARDGSSGSALATLRAGFTARPMGDDIIDRFELGARGRLWLDFAHHLRDEILDRVEPARTATATPTTADLLGGDAEAVELFATPGRATPGYFSVEGAPGTAVALTVEHLETTVAYEPLSPHRPVRIPCGVGTRYVVDLSDADEGARIEVSFVDAYGAQRVLKVVEREEQVRAPGTGTLVLRAKTNAQGTLHVVRSFGDGT